MCLLSFIQKLIITSINDEEKISDFFRNCYRNALKDYLDNGYTISFNNNEFDSSLIHNNHINAYLNVLKEHSSDKIQIIDFIDKLKTNLQPHSYNSVITSNHSESVTNSLKWIKNIFNSDQIDSETFNKLKEKSLNNPIDFIFIELFLKNSNDAVYGEFLSLELYNSFEWNIHVHYLFSILFEKHLNNKFFEHFCNILTRFSLNDNDVVQLHKLLFVDKDFRKSQSSFSNKIIDCFLDDLYLINQNKSSKTRDKKIDILALLIIYSTDQSLDEDIIDLVNVQNSVIHKKISTSVRIISNRDWKSVSIYSSNVYSDLDDLLGTFDCQYVAVGLLKYIEHQILNLDNNTQFSNDLPLPLLIISDLSVRHESLINQIFAILKKLLEHQYQSIDSLIEYQLKENLINQLVHLLSLRQLIEIICYMKNCLYTSSIDISLIRHFCSRVINCVSPPYSKIFADEMRQIVLDNSIFSGIHSSKDKLLFDNFLNDTKDL